MGRDARARKAAEVRIQLDRGDFWELLSISQAIDGLQADLFKFRITNGEEVRQARLRRNAFFDGLAKKYEKLDVGTAYRFEEKTCTLIAAGPAVRADTAKPDAPTVKKPEPKAPPRPAVLGKDKRRTASPSTRVH